MLPIQLKDRCALFCGLLEVVELEVARGAVAVQRDALRWAPRRRQRRRVQLERFPVAAAPVELVRPLHRRRPRHRRRGNLAPIWARAGADFGGGEFGGFYEEKLMR